MSIVTQVPKCILHQTARPKQSGAQSNGASVDRHIAFAQHQVHLVYMARLRCMQHTAVEFVMHGEGLLLVTVVDSALAQQCVGCRGW